MFLSRKPFSSLLHILLSLLSLSLPSGLIFVVLPSVLLVVLWSFALLVISPLVRLGVVVSSGHFQVFFELVSIYVVIRVVGLSRLILPLIVLIIIVVLRVVSVVVVVLSFFESLAILTLSWISIFLIFHTRVIIPPIKLSPPPSIAFLESRRGPSKVILFVISLVALSSRLVSEFLIDVSLRPSVIPVGLIVVVVVSLVGVFSFVVI